MSARKRASSRSGPSVPRSQRQRVAVEATLSREVVASLDALCAQHDVSRSSAIESAILVSLRSGSLERILAECARVAAAVDALE